MTQEPLARKSRFGCAGLVALAFIAVIIAAIGFQLATTIERGMRTEVIGDFGAAGPIHLTPDGHILLARAGASGGSPDGRIEAFDPATRTRATVLDGLVDPIAADMAPDGTVCAIGRSMRVGTPAPLRCSSGLTMDFVAGSPPELDGDGPHPADILSDGSTGWFITDPEQGAVLHVDRSGSISVVAMAPEGASLPARPIGLARDGETLYVAIGQLGYTGLTVDARNAVIAGGTWVGGGTTIAVIARLRLALALITDDGAARVTYSVMADAERPNLVEGLVQPRGMVLLLDGRIAVADGSRLVIVRPARPLP